MPPVPDRHEALRDALTQLRLDDLLGELQTRLEAVLKTLLIGHPEPIRLANL